MAFDAGADRAGQIGKHARRALATEFEADGVGTGRIDHVGGYRLTAGNFLRCHRDQEVRARQFFDDIGNRLRGQRRHAGNGRARHRPVGADGFDHDTPVVRFGLFEIRA